MADRDCILCDEERAAAELNRETVWEDDLWRLVMTHRGYTTGFAYLEPKRHVPHITDLDGDEAATFGPVMARVTSALKEAAGAEIVYVWIFGSGIPHLHVHLGPHRDGDALSSDIIRGELAYEQQASGAQKMVSRDFAELPTEELDAVIDRARELLADEAP
jgi:diadenosine tetraphosphate (Ap4A) HIT family hydrolase